MLTSVPRLGMYSMSSMASMPGLAPVMASPTKEIGVSAP